MKIIKVENCATCPNRDWGTDGASERMKCSKNYFKLIPEVITIPDWCPLEDYNNGKK